MKKEELLKRLKEEEIEELYQYLLKNLDDFTYEIKEVVKKPISKFIPYNHEKDKEYPKSWVGKVFYFKENENIPLDENGKKMKPFVQIYLPSSPYIHPLLKNTKVITVFVSEEFPNTIGDIEEGWIIREYNNLDKLVRKDFDYSYSDIDVFPFKYEFDYDYNQNFYAIEDYLNDENIISAYKKLRWENKIEFKHYHEYKMGGYASYIGRDVYFSPYFIFQILMRGDLVVFSKDEDEWFVYWDTT